MILSIIIAAYNVEKYIEKCILSCAYQNIPIDDYEIIVINDGSTDNTLLKLNLLTNRVSNLKVMNQTNSGLGTTRNNGLEYARGKYVWFIDGDDYIDTNILKDIIKYLQTDIDALVIDYKTINYDYTMISNSNMEFSLKSDKISGSEYYKNCYEKSYSWLFILNKNIFSNNIRFMEKINMQDSEILPKLMLRVKKLMIYKEPVYNYVQHQNTFTNTNNFSKRYFYFQSIIAVKSSLEEQYRTISDNSIKQGIIKKLDSLNQVIFNHIVFFKFKSNDLNKIILLLKKNKLFPLKYKANGKMLIVKYLLNLCPLLTKRLIDKIR